MFSLFLHPWFMVAGGALISAPIVIHMINRMRFKRIRWAAMEFLLKSQKRNRRRLIIEQLLLLLLRCLLVVLAGFLVARFLGLASFGFFQPASTLHVVILDDTLSMSDHWKDEKLGADTNSFDQATILIRDIAKKASAVSSSQEFVVLRLSQCDATPPVRVFDDVLNNDALDRLDGVLKNKDLVDKTELHVAPMVGVKAAAKIFGDSKQTRRFLHFVSDFRDRDWMSGPEAEELRKEVDALCQNKVTVHLVDTAHPYRQAPQGHDNIGIVSLTAETRVAAEGTPVQFSAVIANYSREPKNVFFSVKVDGRENQEASQPIPNVPPGDYTHTFTVSNLAQPGFKMITARLQNADVETGIEADNLRYAVVEVRKQVPVLIVDGNGTDGRKPGGDTYYLQTIFNSAKGYQVVPGSMKDLEESRLDPYPSVFLLNVPQFTERAQKNLEKYVEHGGSVAFFLGDKVRADEYNRSLFKGGTGLFPAPLAPRWRSTSPTDPTKPMAEAEKQQQRNNGLPKIFLRSSTHPILAEVYPLRGLFRTLLIDRYFPVQGTWKSEVGKVEELISLPNLNSIETYRASAQALLKRLPLEDEKYKKFQPGLEMHQRAIRETLLGEHLYLMASAIEDLLVDTGDPKDEQKRPNLQPFWELPDTSVQQLKADIESFRQRVLYGDPLLLARRYGKGRVVAFMSALGSGGTLENPAWHDWAGGSRAAETYPIVMLEMQKFLTAANDDINRIVGTPLTIELDASQFQPRMHGRFKDADEAVPGDGAGRKAELADKGEQPAVQSGSQLTFTFTDTRKPGLYLFDFFPLADKGTDAKPEQKAYVFNPDTAAEGDLKRAPREELERGPANPGPEHGKRVMSDPTYLKPVGDRPTDLSESPWLYLGILLVLIVEQALAVHLSFHLKGNEAPLPARQPLAA